MPELPEVETVVRGLLRQLTGRVIVAVEIFKPLVLKSPADVFRSHLENQKVAGVSRHGKSIFVTLENGRHIKIHLGMTGALLFRPKNHPHDPYVRLRFKLDDELNDLVYRDVRQFGRLSLADQPFERNWGPDAWTSSQEQIFAALRKKKGMIKHALMNQGVIAGLGNIYVDETLFEAGVHPKKKMERLKDEMLLRICEAARKILAKSIDAGGTSFRDYVNTAGKRGDFKKRLNVYGQEGKPCVNCRAFIKKIVVATRGTHFCPRCQRPPARSR